jgi:hypothetical protein
MMDKMLETIQVEVTEDHPTVKVKVFFKLLKVLEELLHEHTEVSLITLITWVITIKCKYFFSINCYSYLMKLIRYIIRKPHKVPKDIYQFKKLLSILNMKYEKIDIYSNNYMLFYKGIANKKK